MQRMKPAVASRSDNSVRRRKSNGITSTMLRSAITNGRQIISDVDHRSAWMRRLRDLVHAHTADLGGEDATSQAEQVLIRRAAMLTLQLEMMEQRFAANDGEASSHQLEVYQRTSNSLRRLLESLGLKRRPKNITPPTLEQYARRLDGEAA
jgi:hypothetical protein